MIFFYVYTPNWKWSYLIRKNSHTLIGDTSLKGWNFRLSFASFLGCSQAKWHPSSFITEQIKKIRKENNRGKLTLLYFPRHVVTKSYQATLWCFNKCSFVGFVGNGPNSWKFLTTRSSLMIFYLLIWWWYVLISQSDHIVTLLHMMA